MDFSIDFLGAGRGGDIFVLPSGKLEKEGAGFEQLEQMTLGALRKAVVDGDTVHGSLMAGQIAGLVNKEQSCKEIIEDIMRQGKALLGERN